jgi:hypothetical protein
VPKEVSTTNLPHFRNVPGMFSFYTYELLACEDVTESVLEECAVLFSGHYGVWGERGVKPGKRVILSASRIKKMCLFDASKCCLATARCAETGELIGHAFLCKVPFFGCGFVWVTQLVVKMQFRHRGIATKLCGLVNDAKTVAWAIVSCHPFAIRAVEKMAGCGVCNVKMISNFAEDLVKAADIPYVHACQLRISDLRCVIDTQYYVDHDEVNQLVCCLSDWKLGDLRDGEEYFAVILGRNEEAIDFVEDSKLEIG